LINPPNTGPHHLTAFSFASLRGRFAVGAVYGKDSDQYEKAGGVRKSERKRPVRKPAAA